MGEPYFFLTPNVGWRIGDTELGSGPGGEHGIGTEGPYIYIYIYIHIYRLPPLPPTSQKVGWRMRLLEALADLGCSLQAFCGIWSALGSARAAKVGYLGLLCRREHRFQGQGEVGGARGLTSCGACGGLWRPSKSPIRR